MRRPIVLFSGWLTAALLVLGPAAPGADDTARREPVEVVLKSLDTKLRVDGRVIDSRGMFLRFRVDTVQGDWLWLVANEGIRGWVHRRDVIPVDQAIAHFSAVIKREPRSARAYRMRGLAYYDAQEYRRAVHDATAATRLEPNLAPAYVDRGHAKLERLDFRGALADANEAIRLDPKSARAYQFRGYVWQIERQYKPAIADYDAAIRLDPNNGILWVCRAQCWSERGDDDRAIADASEAIRLEPTLTWAYVVAQQVLAT